MAVFDQLCRPQPVFEVVEREQVHPLSAPLHRAMRAVDAHGAVLLRLDAVGAASLATVGACDDAALIAPLLDFAALEHFTGLPRIAEPDAQAPLHRLDVPCGRADRHRFVLTFVRDRPGPAFVAADLRAARQAQDWLCDLVALWWRGHADRQLAHGLHAASAADDAGLVLVDGDARILSMNVAAVAVLEAGDGLRRTGPMLTAVQFEDSIRLQTALHQAIATARGSSGARAAMVAVRRRGKRPLAVVVAPIPGIAEAGAAMAFVRVIDPDAEVDHQVAPVCDLYGLSGAEARLALQLARGAALCEAAAKLRIQPDTARTYLKQIFVKTGVKRQAALMRLLLQSQARLGHGVMIAAS